MDNMIGRHNIFKSFIESIHGSYSYCNLQHRCRYQLKIGAHTILYVRSASVSLTQSKRYLISMEIGWFESIYGYLI